MVHQYKRNQSRWSVKAPQETSNAHGSEFTDNKLGKPGMRRTYSGETDLSEAGLSHARSGSSSGDESWSGMSDSGSVPATKPVEHSRTKLSGEAGIFVPQQQAQPSPEPQRTRLSSGASVFVPGQMSSQAPMFMPQMMPMDTSMQYMAPCFYATPDGPSWGMCPVAMPVISGTVPQLVPSELTLDEASNVPAEPQKAMEPEDPVSSPKLTGSPKPLVSPSKSRWADLDDDDDADDPWLSQ